MDYSKILEVAKNRLALTKYNFVIQEIEEIVSLGSTGGEISSMVGKYLKDLNSKNNEVYSILEDSINQYLNDCKKNGLLIL